jgi:uncharacterized protein YbaR (Trm112 family)
MSRVKRLTNEIVDERLIGRNILRLEDYNPKRHIKMKWRCLVDDCNWEWDAIYCNIDAGHGCPKCAGILQITDDRIDEFLIGKPIQRLNSYVNSKFKMKWKCLVDDCNWEWDTVADVILNRNSGCPKCANRVLLTNEQIDEKLIGRNIKRIGDYKGSNKKIDFLCLKDGKVWSSSPSNLIGRNSGCPRCANREALTKEIVLERIKDRSLILLGEITKAHTKTEWKCLVCDHEWPSSPNNIYKGQGCPSCKHKGEKLILDYLKSKYDNVIHHYRLDFDGKKRFIDFKVGNVLIERQGEQHYKPVEHWGGQKVFEQQQLRDQRLRDYCLANNIRLIEIPYWINEEEQYKLLEGLNNEEK